MQITQLKHRKNAKTSPLKYGLNLVSKISYYELFKAKVCLSARTLLHLSVQLAQFLQVTKMNCPFYSLSQDYYSWVSFLAFASHLPSDVRVGIWGLK